MGTFGQVQLPFSSFCRGVTGHGLFLNGYNQYITIRPPGCNSCFGNLANCNNGMSTCLWYKPLAISQYDQTIFSGFNSQIAMIQTPNLGIYAYARAPQNNQNLFYFAQTGPNCIKPGSWFHVCLLYRPQLQIYINGICYTCNQINNQPIPLNNGNNNINFYPMYQPSCNLNIGRPNMLNTNCGNCGFGRFVVDQFQMWNGVLSPSAIYQLQTLAKPSFAWTGDFLPPVSCGSLVGRANLGVGYNDQSLQCLNPGDGMVWNQPLYNQMSPILRSNFDMKELSNAITASLKLQFLRPKMTKFFRQQNPFFYETPIFAMVDSNNAPFLSLSFDPNSGFRALYFANGTSWSINETSQFSLPTSTFLFRQATHLTSSIDESAATNWLDVVVRASPLNGLQIFIDGVQVGTGKQTNPLTIFNNVNVRQNLAPQTIYSDPSISNLNMVLCSPTNGQWFNSANQMYPMRIDNVQLWPALLPEGSITSNFMQSLVSILFLDNCFILSCFLQTPLERYLGQAKCSCCRLPMEFNKSPLQRLEILNLPRHHLAQLCTCRAVTKFGVNQRNSYAILLPSIVQMGLLCVHRYLFHQQVTFSRLLRIKFIFLIVIR